METKKVIGAALALVAAGAIGAVGHDVLEQPETIVKEKIVNITRDVEVPVEVIKEVPVEVEVEKVVEVDNGNLDLVLDEVYDQDGDVEYLLDDLDEDEVDQVVDRIVFKQDTIAQAEELVKNKLVEFMDDEDMFGEGVLDGYRDNDVYSVSLYKDDTEIEGIDFEDKDATVFVEAKLKLEEDDEKLRTKVRAEVEVMDNEFELVNVEILE